MTVARPRHLQLEPRHQARPYLVLNWKMICELRLNTGPRSCGCYRVFIFIPPPTGHSSGQVAGFLAMDKKILWPSNQKYVFPLTFVLCCSNFCPISRWWRQVTSLIPHQNPPSLLATHSLSMAEQNLKLFLRKLQIIVIPAGPGSG